MPSFTIPSTRISSSLAALLNIPGDDQRYSQAQIIKKLHSCLREKGLPLTINCAIPFDSEMRAALGIADEERVTPLNLMRFLRPHCLDFRQIVPEDEDEEE